MSSIQNSLKKHCKSCVAGIQCCYSIEKLSSPEEPGAVKYSKGGTWCLAPGIQDLDARRWCTEYLQYTHIYINTTPFISPTISVFSREQTRRKATFATQEPTRARMQSCEQHCRIANARVNGREGEWWKGRADSGAPSNTDERKACWILIRLPPLFLPLSVPQIENSSEKRVFLKQGGLSLGQPLKVQVQVFLSKEHLFYGGKKKKKRLNQQVTGFWWEWRGAALLFLCLTTLETKSVSVFSFARARQQGFWHISAAWGSRKSVNKIITVYSYI